MRNEPASSPPIQLRDAPASRPRRQGKLPAHTWLRPKTRHRPRRQVSWPICGTGPAPCPTGWIDDWLPSTGSPPSFGWKVSRRDWRECLCSLARPLTLPPRLALRKIQYIRLEFIGGPGRSRTCNQTVMSGIIGMLSFDIAGKTAQPTFALFPHRQSVPLPYHCRSW